MRRPLMWGVLFLVAGMLFLGLAQAPPQPGEASLASQAPAEDDGRDAIASGASMGINLLSLLVGVALILLSLFCFGYRARRGKA